MQEELLIHDVSDFCSTYCPDSRLVRNCCRLASCTELTVLTHFECVEIYRKKKANAT